MRHYFVWLKVFTALTVIMALPGIALLVMIFTLGLTQFLLVLLPMVTLVLWAFLPAVLARHSWRRWPALVLGLALPASLLLLPGTADRKAQELVKAQGLVAAQPLSFSRPSGVEIIRDVALAESPCFDICERLLTGGDVAWVRIVLRDDAFVNTKAQTAARFDLVSNADCHALSADFPTEGSTCIRFAPDDGHKPALVIDLQDDNVGKDRADGAWPLEEISYRTATAHAGDSTDGAILFRGAQLFYKRPNGLVVLDTGDFNSDMGGGIALWRTRAATQPIDLAAAISGLGLALGPARPIPPKTPGTENNRWISTPPDAQDAAYVASLLALGPPFDPHGRSNAFQQVVTGWQLKLQWKKPISEADRVILCASLRDTLEPKSFWAAQLESKDLRC